MRTKTNEKKRYSLRTPRKVALDPENINLQKEKGEGSDSKEPAEFAAMSPIQAVKKTKRKGKPVKSATREEMEEFQQEQPQQQQQNTTPRKVLRNQTAFPEIIPISSTTAQSTPVPDRDILQSPVISQQKQQPIQSLVEDPQGNITGKISKLCLPPSSASTSIEVKQQTISSKAPDHVSACTKTVFEKPISQSKPSATSLSTKDNTKDVPVYTALEHATQCRLDKSCTFQKCSIAKQFLLHFSGCTLKKDDCTICKAMDIMVCKHAEKCERTLDKCCPIPNCDYVRKLMMGEWLKFRNNHHEIVTRAFSGLIHARKCRDSNCDSVLCKNIKAVLLHTQNCNKKEDCKTRKFVVQLCEYHQDTCENENCFVEFCVENRRIRSEESARKVIANLKYHFIIFLLDKILYVFFVSFFAALLAFFLRTSISSESAHCYYFKGRK